MPTNTFIWMTLTTRSAPIKPNQYRVAKTKPIARKLSLKVASVEENRTHQCVPSVTFAGMIQVHARRRRSLAMYQRAVWRATADHYPHKVKKKIKCTSQISKELAPIWQRAIQKTSR